MAPWTRRQVIGTTAGVAVASLTTYVWNLHQHLPARDRDAENRFLRAQDLLLAKGGNGVHSRFVQIVEPRLRVQVLEGGQGEPVLLLHGGNGVAAQWEPLLSRLSSGFHIYAPDRPGCGLTDMFNYRDVPLREHAVNFVLSTMDALGLKTASVIGNSMGGYCALVFALAYPERVKRLVTVGEPAGSSATIPLGNRLLAMRGLNGLMYATVMKPGASATYEGFKRILVAHPDRLSPAYLDCCTAASEIPGATESWLTLLEDCHITSGRSTLTYSLRPELPKLSMPTLLIWGDKDSFGPPSLAKEMAQSIPHGRAEVVPDAGHLAWLDQPDTVADLIANFLRSDLI
jgi:pimeloyl-ACP methyl ester carboxylesterase